MDRKKGHRKSSSDETLRKLILATAVLNLIDTVLEIIKELH